MLDAKQYASRNSCANSSSGVLRRLLRSETGNVMALTAAATLPMLAVIGGAVDISRIYLTKSRVQAACDSAVLAGRKAMSTTTYTDAAKGRARSMFNFNFQEADYAATGTTFLTSADAKGKVSGTATTSIPMAVMGMFGAGPANLSVTCSADIQVPNIDIVMVLDVTGSMNDCPEGKCGSGDERKIDSLKAAAKTFYATLKKEMAGNTTSQIRYGFVPYDQAVNGADLFSSTPDQTKGQLPLSYLNDSMVVQSRVAVFTNVVQWVPDRTASVTIFEQTYDSGSADSKKPFKAVTNGGTDISNSNCTNYAKNSNFGSVTLLSGGSSVLYQKGSDAGTETLQTSAPTTGTSYTKTTFERVSPTWSNGSKKCTRRVIQKKYIKQKGYQFRHWSYEPTTYSVANFKNGNSINYNTAIVDPEYTLTEEEYAATGNDGKLDLVELAQLPYQTGLTTAASSKWDGCLEERNTVPATSFAPIPSGALDLDFISGGTSNELRWRPSLLDLTYYRSSSAAVTNTNISATRSNLDYSCPTAKMRNLNPMTETEFGTYIDSLQPGGYTYLDVGMVWGLRMISPQGMFASRNLTGPNGGQIDRYIIFLTDGVPVSRGNSYTAYSVEDMAKRITGTTGKQPAELHALRFQALCDAMRSKVNIWAIAFGTSVEGNLSACADTGRALQADKKEDLEKAFTDIAKQIADLRLVQ
ncbi:pilus assembly protein [Croceibacterium sp. LX-88]|uniref:Pilus assembly protein n=1 Tax=Croceibacterium selenioxidans TaxID=2838833 RepID=A0ABS5W203_9SPHN|nr:pilus assembly protein [Croceibacterium selenioxidans]MBT2133669.1 pilus assembly protein [Croceibacterium selenioxidans]